MDLHRCLGHISPSAAVKLIDNRTLDGITIRDRDIDFCEVCALAKIKRLPFPKSRRHPAECLGDVIHSDVDLLVSLQGSPGAKVENGGFECWTSFVVERAQLPV